MSTSRYVGYVTLLDSVERIMLHNLWLSKPVNKDIALRDEDVMMMMMMVICIFYQNVFQSNLYHQKDKEDDDENDSKNDIA